MMPAWLQSIQNGAGDVYNTAVPNGDVYNTAVPNGNVYNTAVPNGVSPTAADTDLSDNEDEDRPQDLSPQPQDASTAAGESPSKSCSPHNDDDHGDRSPRYPDHGVDRAGKQQLV